MNSFYQMQIWNLDYTQNSNENIDEIQANIHEVEKLSLQTKSLNFKHCNLDKIKFIVP